MLNHANWKKLCYISEIRHKIDGLDQLDQIKDEQMSLKQIQKLFEESRVSKYHKKYNSLPFISHIKELRRSRNSSSLFNIVYVDFLLYFKLFQHKLC